MWSYIWSVNGKKIHTKPQLEFFGEEDARKDAELHKPLTKKNDKTELEVSSEYKKRPEETMQMQMVLFQVIKPLITDLKYFNCETCQTSPPVAGQKGHMKTGGCLDSEFEWVDAYIQQAWSMINVGDLVAVYNTVCRLLGVSPQGSTLLAKAFLSWISPDGIVDAIEEGSVLHTSEPADMDAILC